MVAELGTAAALRLFDFLVSAGHDTHSDLTEVSTSWQWLGGYVAAHRDAGVPIDHALILRMSEHSVTAAQFALRALLSGLDRPTA